MPCVITDVAMSLNADGSAAPQPAVVITASPASSPVFESVAGAFREITSPARNVTTDVSGNWSMSLPWPSEQDPSTVQWQIKTPDGFVWVGTIPEGIAGPLTLHTLRATYGWAQSASRAMSSMVVVQGPAGPPGTPGAASDIQPVGNALVGGSTGKYADAGHVHTLPDVGNSGTSGGGGNVIESITRDAKGRVTALTTVPATAYDPSVPVVLSFDGLGHVNHGVYYPPAVNLGPRCYYEAVLCYLGTSGYWWSDGYGGAHAMLAGFSGPFASGNVFTGLASTTFGSFDAVAVGEWLHYVVSWDGTEIVVFFDGVPVGMVAFAGPRQSDALINGGGNAFVGGSDHSQPTLRLAHVMAYEADSPLYSVSASSAARCAFAPAWSPLVGAQTAVLPDFLADYTRPGRFIPDSSPKGYQSTFHPGQLFSPHNLTVQTRGRSDIDLLGGYRAPNTAYPVPHFIVDPTAPFGPNAPTPPAAPGSAPSTPTGAKIFDSFTRPDSNYAWTAAPSLGSTEAGSLGPKAWQSKVAYGTNILGFSSWSDWGVFKGRAVNLDTPASPGVFYTLAWVASDSADMDVSVDRNVPGTFDPTGNVGLVARVAADGSSFLYIMSTSGLIQAGFFDGAFHNIYGGAGPVVSAFTTLRVVLSGTTMSIYLDATLQTTVDIATQAAGQTGAGLFRDGAADGLARWDNFLIK